jgi:hypothetical protein
MAGDGKRKHRGGPTSAHRRRDGRMGNYTALGSTDKHEGVGVGLGGTGLDKHKGM